MKKALLSLTFLLVSYISFAQLNCLRPITTNDYNQKKRVVAAISNEADKLQKGIQFVQNNCLSVVQVKDFATMFRNDDDRLQFTQEAYNNTFDKDNFYEVYDTFTKFSDAFRLHDYVLARRAGIITPTTNPNNPTNPTNPPVVIQPTTIEINYPSNIDFPSIAGYSGRKNCTTNLVSEADFNAYMQQIVSSNTEFAKTNYIKRLPSRRAGGNCFTIAQAMKMTLQLPTETTRLEVLKHLYTNFYDLDNISQAVQVFSTRENQDEWLAFIQNPASTPNTNFTPTTTNCVVTSSEFDSLVDVLNKEYSFSNKMLIAKNTCRSFKCFSIEQVRTIMKMFYTEAQKLDIAKYLYDYTNTVQRKQYFTISNEFYSSNTRTDFSNFLAAKK